MEHHIIWLKGTLIINLLYTFKFRQAIKHPNKRLKVQQLTTAIPYNNSSQVLTTLTIKKYIQLYNLNLSYAVLNDKKQSIVIFSITLHISENTSTKPPFSVLCEDKSQFS